MYNKTISQISNLAKKTFGTPVTLTNDTEYTTLADGYFRAYQDTDNSSSLIMYLEDTLVVRFNGGNSQPAYTLFVRKGSKIKYVSSNNGGGGTFYPLV